MFLRMYLVPFFICIMILIYDYFLYYSSESKKIYTDGFNGKKFSVRVILSVIPYVNVFFSIYLLVLKLVNIVHIISEYINSSTNYYFSEKVNKLFDKHINPKIFKNFRK